MKRRDFIKYGATLAGVGGACFICNGKNIFFTTKPTIQNTMDTRPCRVPFESFEIQPYGDYRSCCNGFLKEEKPFGNIEKQDVKEIWNGKEYNDLRECMIKCDFSKCNMDICSKYSPCSLEDIPVDYKNGPKDIIIAYDYECNYNCITCRDKILINSPEEMKLYDEVYLPKITELAKNAKTISLTGSGEVFYSRHSKNLIKTLINLYPEIKFVLFTNGFLMNEKNITELGIQNNIQQIFVSVHAANRETYKKILRTDGFDTVMKNLELVSEWKKQGKIGRIGLNFVVHLMNYKEMPEFIKIAQKLDVGVYFSTYRTWGNAEYDKRYDEVAVFEPTNKHYKELVKILHNPIFKDKKHCYLEPRLADIANS